MCRVPQTFSQDQTNKQVFQIIKKKRSIDKNLNGTNFLLMADTDLVGLTQGFSPYGSRVMIHNTNWLSVGQMCEQCMIGIYF